MFSDDNSSDICTLLARIMIVPLCAVYSAKSGLNKHLLTNILTLHGAAIWDEIHFINRGELPQGQEGRNILGNMDREYTILNVPAEGIEKEDEYLKYLKRLPSCLEADARQEHRSCCIQMILDDGSSLDALLTGVKQVKAEYDGLDDPELFCPEPLCLAPAQLESMTREEAHVYGREICMKALDLGEAGEMLDNMFRQAGTASAGN